MMLSPDMALLYSVLHHGPNGLFVARRHGVKSEHLFGEVRKVYAMVEEFVAKGRAPSLNEVFIQTAVQLDPTIDGSKLDTDLCAKEIARRTLGKHISLSIEAITDLITSGKSFEAREALQQAVHQVSWSIGEFASTESPQTVTELRAAYEKAESNPGGMLGYGSPWPSMDKSSLGLQAEEMTILLAKKKQGKTWCKLAWVNHLWSNELKAGDKILFASMEMSALSIYRRLAAIHLRLDYELFRGGKLSTLERERFFQWCDRLMKPQPQDAHVVVVTSDQVPTVRDLAAVVAQVRPKIVFIDGLYIFQAPGANKWEQMLVNIVETKLRICAQFKLPVVASSQLKGSVASDVLVADSDDAGYAKAIGEYADAVRGLFSSAEHKRDGQRIWRGMESREFVPVDLLINFDLHRMDFSEIEVIDPEAELAAQAAAAAEDDDDTDEAAPRRRKKGKKQGRAGPPSVGPVMTI